MTPPPVRPEPDWEEFTLPFDIGSGRSMFVETANGPTIRMRFFRRRTDSALVGRVWFGPATFGPPGFVHGGVIAFVLDEAMGSCAWLRGYPCVAVNLDVGFDRMTPLERDCTVEATITELEPRKLVVEASLSLGEETLAHARGSFARIRKERFLETIRQRRSEMPDLSGFEFAGRDAD